MNPGSDGKGSFVRRLLNRPEGGLSLAILVVVGLTALVDDQHTYWTKPAISFENVLRQTSLLGIFALGAAIVIISGGIDLSSGAVIAFSGSLCATVMLVLAPDGMKGPGQGVGMVVIVVAITATLLVGFLIGTLHTWLITVVGLPPFVATLATLVGLRSLARAMIENVTRAVNRHTSTQIQIWDEQFRTLKEVWLLAIVFAVLAVLAWLLLSRTVVGRHLHALGGNESAARLSGIRTDRLKWLAYSISAMVSALAGILYIADQSVAAPQTLALGYELNAIASAVVGGCSLKGGVGTIPGVVLGTLFLRTVMDGVYKVIKSGADVYEGLIVGGVVVVAVAFNQLRQAGKGGTQFFAGVLGLVSILNLTLLVAALTALVGRETALGSWAGSAAVAVVTLVLLLAVRFYEGRRGGS